ncbi:MAG: c-type cytochrome biogenesis protein CcsB [Deltaproteobacteria bacterium]
MEVVLLEVASALYLVATSAFCIYLLRSQSKAGGFAPVALAAGFAVHSVAVGLRSLSVGMLPVTGFSEGMSFFAWLMVGAFLVLNGRYRLKVLGAVTSPLACALTAGSLLFYEGPTAVPELLRSPWLPVHVTLAFLGHAIFALAFAVSSAYLLQERLLKSHRSGQMISRLPSLEKLDRLNYRCLAWGLPLLTLAILSGGIWASAAWGRFWSWEPREVLSLVTWVIYAALLRSRLTADLRGRKAAVYTMVGFAVLVASYLSVNILPLAGRHGGGFGS